MGVMKASSENRINDILKSAIDQNIVPYLVTDINGIIIYANNAMSLSTGYANEELTGQKTSLFKSGKHNTEFYKRMWTTILDGNFYTSRLINKRKDGTLYQLRINIQPIKIDGKIKFFLSREEDLSAIIELENKLIETQKLESVALMVSELSHDFNNFLTVVIGAIELIKDELDAKTVQYQLANELFKSAKEQANTIKQLLIFSRKSQILTNELDLNRLLTDIKPLIQSQITARIKLIYELDSNIYKIKSDEQLIKQAILNLTSNAKDSIESNGDIIIKTYNYTCDDEYHEPYHEGIYTVMEVIDSGKGLTEEASKHLFEPFFTTKPKGKGTGLGLSSVYGIVKNHGGYIYASNRKDSKGASFRIYLPAISK
jgi:PAS domain S-box-containing protein